MKLCLTNPQLELPVASTPYFSWDHATGDCSRASFSLTGSIALAEGEKITGLVSLKSDDDMVLNEVNADTFLRYELSEYTDETSKVTTTYLTFTNDPVPEPVEPPPPPTEEELINMERPSRLASINSTRDQLITAGFDVTTEFGLEHFTLQEKDKTLLLGIYAMVQQGATKFPYHSVNADNTTNICTIYTDADISNIATTAFGFITYHESYANMLIQWANRVTTLAELQTIQYGAALPTDLQEYLAMVLTAAGVPVPETTPTVTPESNVTVDSGSSETPTTDTPTV